MRTFEQVIRRKDGSISAYGFACGYVEARNPSPSVTLTLWMEHGTFHVRAYDFASRGRLVWESFPTLTEARKFYASWKDEVKA